MIRRIGIEFASPFSLRSPKRLPALLGRFEEIEADSAWQIIQVLNNSSDLELKRKLFHNAREEVDHARQFRKLARQYARYPISPMRQQRRRLFENTSSVVEFEAYLYIGEGDVYREFGAYARAAGPGVVRDTFLRIRGDEEEHQATAFHELVRMAGSHRDARRLVRKIRMQRACDRSVRGSQRIGAIFTGAVLSSIYFVFGALFGARCHRRLATSA